MYSHLGLIYKPKKYYLRKYTLHHRKVEHLGMACETSTGSITLLHAYYILTQANFLALSLLEARSKL